MLDLYFTDHSIHAVINKNEKIQIWEYNIIKEFDNKLLIYSLL